MVERAPVYWSDALNRWLVTGYDEVREVFIAHERFSNVGVRAANLLALTPETRAQLPLVEMSETTEALNASDPPVHTRHRGWVNRSLTPRSLAQTRSWMQELCNELVDSLAKQSEPDLLRDFTIQLSYRSILGLFGASYSDIPVFQEVSDARREYGRAGGSNIEDALRYERALSALRSTLEGLYAQRRGRDEGHIIDALLKPNAKGDRLSDDELFVILKIFFAAGHENIVYSIFFALWALLRSPEQLSEVRSDPSLLAKAYEEGVRWETFAQANGRVARVDTELGGELIRAGDRLLNFKGAANRDPGAWTDPDRFDIHRDMTEAPSGTLAFGRGIHFCIGAGMARQLGPMAIGTLLERFPRLRLVEGWEPRWAPMPTYRRPLECPLLLE